MFYPCKRNELSYPYMKDEPIFNCRHGDAVSDLGQHCFPISHKGARLIWAKVRKRAKIKHHT